MQASPRVISVRPLPVTVLPLGSDCRGHGCHDRGQTSPSLRAFHLSPALPIWISGAALRTVSWRSVRISAWTERTAPRRQRHDNPNCSCNPSRRGSFGADAPSQLLGSGLTHLCKVTAPEENPHRRVGPHLLQCITDCPARLTSHQQTPLVTDESRPRSMTSTGVQPQPSCPHGNLGCGWRRLSALVGLTAAIALPSRRPTNPALVVSVAREDLSKATNRFSCAAIQRL